MNATKMERLEVAAKQAATPETWAANVHSHFAFMIKDYGFRVERVKYRSRYCEIVYQSETTEVRIGWQDIDGFDLTFERLIRLRLRAFPQPYPVLDAVEESLEFCASDLLRLRAPHLLKELTHSYGRRVWSLELLAQAVQAHAKDLLKGESSAFESIEAFVKKREEACDKVERITEKESREVPQPLQWTFKLIAHQTAQFCDDYLDSEYAEICRRIAKDLCQIPDSPLVSGRFERWAGAIVYAMCHANDLFDPSHSSHVSAEAIARHFDLTMTTIQARSKKVRQLLKESPTTSTLLRRMSDSKRKSATKESSNERSKSTLKSTRD